MLTYSESAGRKKHKKYQGGRINLCEPFYMGKLSHTHTHTHIHTHTHTHTYICIDGKGAINKGNYIHILYIYIYTCLDRNVSQHALKYWYVKKEI